MQAYQRDFIRFAIDRGVLRFGEFTLKSGRTSPYFFNAGRFQTGQALAELGRYYAAAITASSRKAPQPMRIWRPKGSVSGSSRSPSRAQS